MQAVAGWCSSTTVLGGCVVSDVADRLVPARVERLARASTPASRRGARGRRRAPSGPARRPRASGSPSPPAAACSTARSRLSMTGSRSRSKRLVREAQRLRLLALRALLEVLELGALAQPAVRGRGRPRLRARRARRGSTLDALCRGSVESLAALVETVTGDTVAGRSFGFGSAAVLVRHPVSTLSREIVLTTRRLART